MSNIYIVYKIKKKIYNINSIKKAAVPGYYISKFKKIFELTSCIIYYLLMDYKNYKRRTYLLQFQNKSEYMGYNIWAATGETLDAVNFREPYRKVENIKCTGTFVKIYCGWD